MFFYVNIIEDIRLGIWNESEHARVPFSFIGLREREKGVQNCI